MVRKSLGLSEEQMKARKAEQKKAYRERKRQIDPIKFKEHQSFEKWLYRQFHPEYAKKEAQKKKDQRKGQSILIMNEPPPKLTKNQRKAMYRRFFKD